MKKNNQSYIGVIQIILVFALVGAIVYGLNRLGVIALFQRFPIAKAGMGMGMLFLIGLVTSIHCVVMCGGINLTQSCKAESQEGSLVKRNLLYQTGRIISYTIIGGAIGLLGQTLSITPRLQGGIQMAAGVLLLVMGLSLIPEFAFLRGIRIPLPGFVMKKIQGKGAEGSSFLVGLANGFMPCGPLQGMQLVALASGSLVLGGMSMFFFGLGTLPLMLTMGLLGGKLSLSWKKIMMTATSALIVIMAVFMISSGTALTGLYVGKDQKNSSVEADSSSEELQLVETSLTNGRYESIEVRQGIPVKWVIHVSERALTGCNQTLYIPEYDLTVQLKVGDNVVEFTPEHTGTFQYSCWMGMIRSTIKVKN